MVQRVMALDISVQKISLKFSILDGRMTKKSTLLLLLQNKISNRFSTKLLLNFCLISQKSTSNRKFVKTCANLFKICLINIYLIIREESCFIVK